LSILWPVEIDPLWSFRTSTSGDLAVQVSRLCRNKPTGENESMVGVVVLFVQIGALSAETQYPCGFPAGATPAE
jgi:hypothetical protein